MQILSFACGVVAADIPAGLPLSPPVAAVATAVLPVVDEIVTGGGGSLAGVDVDELSWVGTVVTVVDAPAAADWALVVLLQMLAMIMSLRVRGLLLETAGSEVLAGSEVAL